MKITSSLVDFALFIMDFTLFIVKFTLLLVKFTIVLVKSTIPHPNSAGRIAGATQKRF